MIDRRSRSRWLSQRFVWLVLVFACLGVMPRHAAAGPVCLGLGLGSTTLTLPPVTVMTSAPVGTKLGSPVSGVFSFTCTGITTETIIVEAGGLAPRDATSNPPAGGGISFATSVPGIALVLTASPAQASDNACPRCGPGGTPGWEATSTTQTGTLSVTLTAQFMKTGPVTAGAVSSIPLVQFFWYISGSPSPARVQPMSTVTLNTSTISVQACSVNTDSTNLMVNLLSVSTQALQTKGAVAGRTLFNINLTCQPGANVSIAMTPSADGGVTGTIANTGTAKKVNVQLLDGSFNPVTFGTATSLGAAPNGTLSIPYYAQYYTTAAAGAGAGSVTASATFAITYQ